MQPNNSQRKHRHGQGWPVHGGREERQNFKVFEEEKPKEL